MKRWAGGLAILAALGVALYGAMAVGEMRGQAREIERYARADAERVAALMVSGKIDLAVRLRLVTKEAGESLKEASRKHGAATKVEIQDISAGPFGLPVPIDLRVMRGGKVRQEGLTRQSRTTPLAYWSGD